MSVYRVKFSPGPPAVGLTREEDVTADSADDAIAVICASYNRPMVYGATRVRLPRIRALELEVEHTGGPSSCDWGDCGRTGVGWAQCWPDCPEPEHVHVIELPRELGGPFRLYDAEAGYPWLPVCRAAAIVAAETGHDVRLLGEVLEGMHLEAGHAATVPELVAAEAELRGELAYYRATLELRRHLLAEHGAGTVVDP